MIDLTTIMQAVISLAAILISIYLIPFIKQKLGAEKLDKVLTWVETLVACADQIYQRHEGEAKKQYVIERLTCILKQYNLTVDMQVLEDLIEAEVLRLHSELKSEGVID